MVYQYQYHVDIGDISVARENLEQALEPMSEIFEQNLIELKQYAPTAESIIVEYIDKDKNLIYAREFK